METKGRREETLVTCSEAVSNHLHTISTTTTVMSASFKANVGDGRTYTSNVKKNVEQLTSLFICLVFMYLRTHYAHTSTDYENTCTLKIPFSSTILDRAELTNDIA